MSRDWIEIDKERTYFVTCERCQHEFEQRCSLDGGPSPAWRPFTNELCPGCGEKPEWTFRELNPDAPENMTVVEFWEWCVNKAVMEQLSSLEAIRDTIPTKP